MTTLNRLILISKKKKKTNFFKVKINRPILVMLF